MSPTKFYLIQSNFKRYLSFLNLNLEKFEKKTLKQNRGGIRLYLCNGTFLKYFKIIKHNFNAHAIPVFCLEDFYLKPPLQKWNFAKLISKCIFNKIPLLIVCSNSTRFEQKTVIHHLLEYSKIPLKKLENGLNNSLLYMLQNKPLFEENLPSKILAQLSKLRF